MNETQKLKMEIGSECSLCDRLHLRQYLKKSGHSSHKPFGLAQEILRDCEFAAFLL